MICSLKLRVTIMLAFLFFFLFLFFCLWFELCVSPKVVTTGNVTGDAAVFKKMRFQFS